MNTLKVTVNGKKLQVEGVYVNHKQWAMKLCLADGPKMFSMMAPAHTVGKKWTLKPTVKKNVVQFIRITDENMNPETMKWLRRTKFVTNMKVKAGKKVSKRTQERAEELTEAKALREKLVAFKTKLESRNYESFVTSMSIIIRDMDDIIVDMR